MCTYLETLPECTFMKQVLLDIEEHNECTSNKTVWSWWDKPQNILIELNR